MTANAATMADRRHSPCVTFLSICALSHLHPLSCRSSYFISYSKTNTRPCFGGAVFYAPTAAHGLHRGPFFVSDPRYQCHRRARKRLYSRAVCVRDMEPPITGQRSTPGTPGHVLARFYGYSSPVFTPVALIHRPRYCARFWGIAAPHSSISDAARERL